MSTLGEAAEGVEAIRDELKSTIQNMLTGQKWNTDSSKDDMCVVRTLESTSCPITQLARENALKKIADDFVEATKSRKHAPDFEFTLKGNTLRLIFRNEDTYQAFSSYIGVQPESKVAGETLSPEELVKLDREARNGPDGGRG